VPIYGNGHVPGTGASRRRRAGPRPGVEPGRALASRATPSPATRVRLGRTVTRYDGTASRVPGLLGRSARAGQPGRCGSPHGRHVGRLYLDNTEDNRLTPSGAPNPGTCRARTRLCGSRSGRLPAPAQALDRALESLAASSRCGSTTPSTRGTPRSATWTATSRCSSRAGRHFYVGVTWGSRTDRARSTGYPAGESRRSGARGGAGIASTMVAVGFSPGSASAAAAPTPRASGPRTARSPG